MDVENIIIAAITVFGSIVVARITAGQKAKTTAEKAISESEVAIRERLIKLETTQTHIKENMFSNEDRKCLQEVETTLNLLLSTSIIDAVNNLKNPPALDTVFTRIETEIKAKGTYTAVFPVFDDLTPTQSKLLTEHLQKIIESDRSPLKRQQARLILGLKRLHDNGESPTACVG